MKWLSEKGDIQAGLLGPVSALLLLLHLVVNTPIFREQFSNKFPGQDIPLAGITRLGRPYPQYIFFRELVAPSAAIRFYLLYYISDFLYLHEDRFFANSALLLPFRLAKRTLLLGAVVATCAFLIALGVLSDGYDMHWPFYSYSVLVYLISSAVAITALASAFFMALRMGSPHVSRVSLLIKVGYALLLVGLAVWGQEYNGVLPPKDSLNATEQLNDVLQLVWVGGECLLLGSAGYDLWGGFACMRLKDQ